jgi:hypothetical protein
VVLITLTEVKSDKYMYNIDTETIYYIEKNTKSYFHEYTHYLLNKNKRWRKVNYFLDYYNQFLNMIIFFTLLILLVIHIFYIKIPFNSFLELGFIYLIKSLPIMIFMFVEEFICDVYARKLYNKYIKH